MDIESFFAQSHFHMTDVNAKTATFRRAIAMGRIHIGATAMERLIAGNLPKGEQYGFTFTGDASTGDQSGTDAAGHLMHLRASSLLAGNIDSSYTKTRLRETS